MVVERTDKGVIVRYQNADHLDKEAAVRVTPAPGGDGVRLDLHRVGQKDTTLHLTSHDVLALETALAVSEVPRPRTTWK